MTESTPRELTLSLFALQTKIVKQLASALTPHGISFTEYLVLLQLETAPDNRMRRVDLAQSVGLTASGVTRLLNPMEKIGLVLKEANARDARVSLVALSEAGQSIFQDARVSYNNAIEEIFAPLGEKKQKALSGLIKDLM